MNQIARVVMVVAAWACGPLAGSAAQQAPQPGRWTVRGSLTYQARIALPRDSQVVIGLHDVTRPGAALVAERRIDLRGRQVPVPFELTVDGARLVAGNSYVVRGTILAAGRPAWATEEIVVDPSAGDVDLGPLPLTPVKGSASQTHMICGSERIALAGRDGVLRLTVLGETYELRQVKAASGAKYEAVNDATTTFWSRGNRATVVLRGKTLPECVTAGSTAPSFFAIGHEPGWRIDIGDDRITLIADYGSTRIALPTPSAKAVPGGRTYAGRTGHHDVAVTVLDRPCADAATGMPHPSTVEVLLDGRTLRGCGGAPVALLRGGAWVVGSLDGVPVADGSRITIQFGDDGHVSGSASCNTYSGRYTLTPERLTIDQVVTMMKACLPDLMKQEEVFLRLLRTVQRFELNGADALVLHAASSGRIAARREPQEDRPMASQEPTRLRDLARRYTAAWCSQNAATVAAFFAPNGSLRVNDDAPAVGRKAITDVAQGFMTAFPDVQVLKDDVSRQGDRAVYR